MEAPFLLWSSSEAPTAEAQLPDTAAPPEVPKPKARKGGSKPPAPKRPPQRGLGVAQLERLRLGQERWRKITESDPSSDGAIHQPVPLHGGASWPGSCYLPPCRMVGSPGLACYAGGGGVSAVGSALLDQYTVDRVRVSGFGFQPGSPAMLLEPPSNQSQKTSFASDHCDFCARKKRLYGENLGVRGPDGQDYSVMDIDGCLAVDEEREAVGYYEQKRVVREYEFFPRSGGAALGDSEFGDRTVGDASSSSSAAASTPGFLDLTLKLSSC